MSGKKQENLFSRWSEEMERNTLLPITTSLPVAIMIFVSTEDVGYRIALAVLSVVGWMAIFFSKVLWRTIRERWHPA